MIPTSHEKRHESKNKKNICVSLITKVWIYFLLRKNNRVFLTYLNTVLSKSVKKVRIFIDTQTL